MKLRGSFPDQKNPCACPKQAALVGIISGALAPCLGIPVGQRLQSILRARGGVASWSLHSVVRTHPPGSTPSLAPPSGPASDASAVPPPGPCPHHLADLIHLCTHDVPLVSPSSPDLSLQLRTPLSDSASAPARHLRQIPVSATQCPSSSSVRAAPGAVVYSQKPRAILDLTCLTPVPHPVG